MFRVEDSRRLNGGAMSSLIFPNRLWPGSQSGRDLLLYRAAFWAWLFSNLFRIGTSEHIAGLTLKCVAHLLQCFKIDSECLTLFQPPQCRMADAGLFREPIERSTAVFQ